jgi:hypothetical protein
LDDLVAKFGLERALPPVPEGRNSKLAWLLGTLLTQTAFGEVDDVVLTDLAAARQARAS